MILTRERVNGSEIAASWSLPSFSSQLITTPKKKRLFHFCPHSCFLLACRGRKWYERKRSNICGPCSRAPVLKFRIHMKWRRHATSTGKQDAVMLGIFDFWGEQKLLLITAIWSIGWQNRVVSLFWYFASCCKVQLQCQKGQEGRTEQLMKKAEKNFCNYVQGSPSPCGLGWVDLDLK